MKITSLEEQKKRRERLNLYVDSVFKCRIDIGTAARLGLYVGKEVSESDLAGLDNEEEYQKCITAALGLASRRMQSEREYWQKLGKKYEKPLIGRCLDRLRELGYANDEHFTEMWVKERSKTRGYRMLEVELKQKGISPELIAKHLSEDKESSFCIALDLAQKKYNAEATHENNYSKVISYLTRRGFSYDTSKKVLSELEKTVD